jgi:ABC-type molybdate transport system substrate-binding protein
MEDERMIIKLTKLSKKRLWLISVLRKEEKDTKQLQSTRKTETDSNQTLLVYTAAALRYALGYHVVDPYAVENIL